MRKWIVGAALAALIALVVVSSTALASPRETDLKKVTLRLDWLYGGEHAPYYVAAAKGYFKDAGLDVKIAEGNGSTVSAKLVGNGSDTFGVCSAGTVLASVGNGVPIKAVATIFQSVPSGVVSPMDKKITKLSQLYGKTLGLDPTSDDFNAWQAVASLNHIDRSKIHEVSVGGNAVQSFMLGRVDAFIGWTFNEALEATLKDKATNTLKFDSLGLTVPGSTIIASDSTIKNDPQTVKAFVGAVLKGWQYTIAHPKDALAIFLAAHKDIDAKYNTAKLPLVLEQVKVKKGQKLGVGVASHYQQLENIYLKAKIIKKPVPVTTVFTNQFLT
jgi:NitT/TauT family transport system substrate-binding protein